MPHAPTPMLDRIFADLLPGDALAQMIADLDAAAPQIWAGFPTADELNQIFAELEASLNTQPLDRLWNELRERWGH